MKKIKIAIVLLGLIFTGCSGYLDEENLGNIVEEEYYTTASGYESLVNSAYASLRNVYQPTPYIFCAGTDLFFSSHDEVPAGLASYKTLTPGTTEVSNFFNVLYQGIKTVNLGLAYADKTEDFTALQTRVAELKTIRAYYYFLLVQNFGGVSLVTEPVKAPPVTHFERASSSEVYQFVIDELNAAIVDLPVTQTNFGRVTKRAAQHILAKAYLTRGYESFATPTDFSDAAALADAAIAGQNLTLSFEELFAYTKDKNVEILWSVQYAPGSTQSGGLTHNWDYPWGPLVQGSNDGVVKKSTLHPTQYLLTLFEDNDTRFEGTFLNIKTTPYSGWKLNPAGSPVAYYYPRTVAQIAAVPAWRAADPVNRTNTIISPIGAHWWDRLNTTDYPALKKYDRVQTSTPSSIQYTHDLYLARLGETYLIAAEAYFKAGNIGNAIDRVNVVRQRAGASIKTSIDLDFILEERARELAGEGFRWLDLKRTGKLMEYTKVRNPDIKALFDGGTDPFLGKGGNFKILRPIPLSAISLDSGDYPQNPAY